MKADELIPDFSGAMADVVAQLQLDRCDTLKQEFTCSSRIETTLENVARKLGFKFFQYTRRVLLNTTSSISDSYSAMFGNYPNDWTECYFENEYYQYDPVVLALTHNFKDNEFRRGTWRDAESFSANATALSNLSDIRERSSLVMERARQYGLNSGIFCAVGRAGSQSFISFATSKDSEYVESIINEEFWRTTKSIMLIFEDIVAALQRCTLCSRGVINDAEFLPRLTPAQKIILSLYLKNADATLEVIAKLHNTSSNNIAYHLKEIRHRLGLPKVSGQMLAHYAKQHHLL